MGSDANTIISNITKTSITEMKGYSIWLSWNNQAEGFQIPVNPESIEIGDGNGSKTYDVIGLGEISVIKSPKLTDFSFSSFFPTKGKRVALLDRGIQYDPLVVGDYLFDKPEIYVEHILRWMGTKRPIRFVFIGDSFIINEAVSIESFQWKDVAGSNGDIEYTLNLKKYVFYAAQKAIKVADSNQEITLQKESPARQDERQASGTYSLVAGDSLWKVAQKIYNDGARWKEIQQYNNIADSQLKSLPIGMVIKIP